MNNFYYQCQNAIFWKKHQGYSSWYCQKMGFEVGNGIELFYVRMYVYMSWNYIAKIRVIACLVFLKQWTIYRCMWKFNQWVGLQLNSNFQENEASYDSRFCYANMWQIDVYSDKVWTIFIFYVKMPFLKWGFEVGNGIEPFYVRMFVYMSWNYTAKIRVIACLVFLKLWTLYRCIGRFKQWVGLQLNSNFQENKASYDSRFCYAHTLHIDVCSGRVFGTYWLYIIQEMKLNIHHHPYLYGMACLLSVISRFVGAVWSTLCYSVVGIYNYE